jgi:hypothetical protein
MPRRGAVTLLRAFVSWMNALAGQAFATTSQLYNSMQLPLISFVQSASWQPLVIPFFSSQRA